MQHIFQLQQANQYSDHGQQWRREVSVGASKGATDGRFKRGQFLVNVGVFYEVAPFGALFSVLVSSSDPVGALAPFELFSRDPRR